MQENRCFDHYFGTMRGVRGFGDRFPIPLASGKPVWFQSDGDARDPRPFASTPRSMNAALIGSGTPHIFADSQAAWNQGKFGSLAEVQEPALSMGYYRRDDIPFQFALAEAFTICDGYHCSSLTGTDPNRIVFWSGSNFNPELRAQGINCTDADGEPVNLRCWITGALPDARLHLSIGNAFKWATMPDVLQQAGISWRIYQDPNDNWTGAMHGCLAFESFRTAQPGSPIYEHGMSGDWSADDAVNPRPAQAGRAATARCRRCRWVLPSQALVRASRRPVAALPAAPTSPAGAGRADGQSGSLEQDRLLPDLRRERRLLRPPAAAGGAVVRRRWQPDGQVDPGAATASISTTSVGQRT